MFTGIRDIIYLKDNKILFTFPRCASTYIRGITEKHPNTRKIVSESILDKEVLYQYKKYNFDIACFVRNPYDRLVSVYSLFNDVYKPDRGNEHWSQVQINGTFISGTLKGVTGKSFKEFIMGIPDKDEDCDRHYRPISYSIKHKKELIPQKIIKWDFKELHRFLNISPDDTAWKNSSKRGKDTMEYYDRESYKFIEHRYKEDLDMAGK